MEATVPRKRRRWLWWGIALLGAPPLLALGMHQWVTWSVDGFVCEPEAAPQKDVILVLGASVRPDGTPSDMLADRLATALDLYRSGRAGKILVSGDHGQRDYDEVRVMAEVLEAGGVPARDLFLDHAGFRTLDSAVRARRVFGVESALVVSNPFHVPRAVFLARQAGIDATGVNATPRVRYSRDTRWRHEAREALARVLAFLDVHVLGTEPRYLGDPIDITGDGRVTRDD